MPRYEFGNSQSCTCGKWQTVKIGESDNGLPPTNVQFPRRWTCYSCGMVNTLTAMTHGKVTHDSQQPIVPSEYVPPQSGS